MEQKRRMGCLRGGCFGVLGCTGLFVVFVVVVTLLRVSMGVPEAAPVHRDLEQALPYVSSLDGHGEGGEAPPRPGRVVLDLGIGEHEIVAGPAGEPIRVEADFDGSHYDLTDELEADPAGGWEYRISFRRSIAWFRQRFDDQDLRVRIVLPRGVPFALEGEIGIGESELQLGGLWLTDVDLRFGVGERRIEFDEPLVEPLGLLRLKGSIGETRVRGLGNASPAETHIGMRVGELRVGLDGAWRRDGDVRVDLQIGELFVSAPPEDVRVEFPDGRFAVSSSADVPTVVLRPRNSIGEFRIDH